jgi:hypothetical protein
LAEGLNSSLLNESMGEWLRDIFRDRRYKKSKRKRERRS